MVCLALAGIDSEARLIEVRMMNGVVDLTLTLTLTLTPDGGGRKRTSAALTIVATITT